MERKGERSETWTGENQAQADALTVVAVGAGGKVLADDEVFQELVDEVLQRLARLLNVDGYEVLSMECESKTVRLN